MKRLMLLFALFTLLAAPASAHDADQHDTAPLVCQAYDYLTDNLYSATDATFAAGEAALDALITLAQNGDISTDDVKYQIGLMDDLRERVLTPAIEKQDSEFAIDIIDRVIAMPEFTEFLIPEAQNMFTRAREQMIHFKHYIVIGKWITLYGIECDPYVPDEEGADND